MNTKSKAVLGTAATVILAFVIWAYFERASTSLTLVLVSPGLFVDALISGNFHGGFGDWRDFVLIVGASWVVWALPLLFVCLLVRRLLRKNENTKAQLGSNGVSRKEQNADFLGGDSGGR